MEQREWKEAEDTFKELLREADTKHDLYVTMAMGAIPLNSLSGEKRKASRAASTGPPGQLCGRSVAAFGDDEEQIFCI